jgi:hypothetical protein
MQWQGEEVDEEDEEEMSHFLGGCNQWCLRCAVFGVCYLVCLFVEMVFFYLRGAHQYQVRVPGTWPGWYW